MRFIFHGIGSEYPFHALASFVRQAGHEVLEIDMYQKGWQDRMNIFYLAGSFRLVTSHHPYMDQFRHKMEFGVNAEIASLPEFISKWIPEKIYFIPHDLVDPIKDEEIWFVKYYSAILMPCSKWQWLSDRTQVFDVGFIKRVSNTDVISTDVSFLPSEVAFYLRGGWDHFLKCFSDVIALKPRIKFPAFPGTQDFEDRLTSFGCEVVNSSVSSTSLISSSKIIISNGLSSIVGESAVAGVSTICIMDDIHSRNDQYSRFGLDPFVKLVERQNAANLAREWLTDLSDKPNPPSAIFFDYHITLDIISH